MVRLVLSFPRFVRTFAEEARIIPRPEGVRMRRGIGRQKELRMGKYSRSSDVGPWAAFPYG